MGRIERVQVGKRLRVRKELVSVDWSRQKTAMISLSAEMIGQIEDEEMLDRHVQDELGRAVADVIERDHAYLLVWDRAREHTEPWDPSRESIEMDHVRVERLTLVEIDLPRLNPIGEGGLRGRR